jgi:hypothetical protein
MAQIVYGTARDKAHILVGVSPRATSSLCGATASIFGHRIQAYAPASWPRLDTPWCRACLAAFAPDLIGV